MCKLTENMKCNECGLCNESIDNLGLSHCCNENISLEQSYEEQLVLATIGPDDCFYRRYNDGNWGMTTDESLFTLELQGFAVEFVPTAVMTREIGEYNANHNNYITDEDMPF